MSASVAQPVYLFTAFEPSGDVLAAPVIAELRRRQPEAKVWALGGPRMEAAGATLIDSTTDDAVMLGSALRHARLHMRRVTRLKAWLAEHPITALLPVDSPAANWSICKAVRKTQPAAKIVHLVAPQLWAWGPWRIRKLRRLTDHVLCVLPFEPAWFAERGVEATFVGHPLFDQHIDGVAARSKAEALAEVNVARVGESTGNRRAEMKTNDDGDDEYGDDGDGRDDRHSTGETPGPPHAAPVPSQSPDTAPLHSSLDADWPAGAPRIALLPGSRAAENHLNWPTMLSVFARLRRRHPNLAAVVAMADRKAADRVAAMGPPADFPLAPPIANTRSNTPSERLPVEVAGPPRSMLDEAASIASLNKPVGERATESPDAAPAAPVVRAADATVPATAPSALADPPAAEDLEPSWWPDAMRLKIGQTDEALAWADIVLVVSGTATLQTAAHRTPMVILFNTERWKWRLLGQWIIKTRTFSLPNLIAGAGDTTGRIVPEFTPHFGDPEPVTAAVDELLSSEAAYRQQVAALTDVCHRFDDMPFARETVDRLLKIVHKTRTKPERAP